MANFELLLLPIICATGAGVHRSRAPNRMDLFTLLWASTNLPYVIDGGIIGHGCDLLFCGCSVPYSVSSSGSSEKFRRLEKACSTTNNLV